MISYYSISWHSLVYLCVFQERHELQSAGGVAVVLSVSVVWLRRNGVNTNGAAAKEINLTDCYRF